jgi:hypothetical protein
MSKVGARGALQIKNIQSSVKRSTNSEFFPSADDKQSIWSASTSFRTILRPATSKELGSFIFI